MFDIRDMESPCSMVYVLVIGREHSSLKRPSLTAQQIYYKFVMFVRDMKFMISVLRCVILF